MKKSISEFYREELNSWIDSILFYLIEINKMEDRLKEVISRDGIVDIAAKVEVYQLMLNKSKNKFEILKDEVIEQKITLQTNVDLFDDTHMKREAKNKMKLLALHYKQVELEYINVKDYCTIFLNDILN